MTETPVVKNPARQDLLNGLRQSKEDVKSLLSEEALAWYDWEEPPMHITEEIEALEEELEALRRDDPLWVEDDESDVEPYLSEEAFRFWGRHRIPPHVAEELKVAENLLSEERQRLNRQYQLSRDDA